jgi:hypothetical protein
MGEAAESIDWWPMEAPVDMSGFEDTALLATGESDEDWLYGSD